MVLELFCQNTPFAHILAIPSIKTPPTFFIWKTTIANEFLLGFFLVFRKILFKKNEFFHLKSLIGMKTPPKTPLLNKPETPLGNFKTPLGGANTPVQETLPYMMAYDTLGAIIKKSSFTMYITRVMSKFLRILAEKFFTS